MVLKGKSLANTYADMNKIIYGGDKIIDETVIKLSDYNSCNISDYDMNKTYNDNDIEYFLNEIDIDYDYEDLFDFIEDEIPLSRLINNILKDILKEYDGFIILEDDIKTVCIKN